MSKSLLVASLLALLPTSLSGCASPAPAPTSPASASSSMGVNRVNLVRETLGPNPTPSSATLTLEPTRTSTTRNQGHGPYDSLEKLCGAGDQRRCVVGTVVDVTGSPTVRRVADFRATRMDGMASLALETKDGWYVTAPPASDPHFMLSHHTPAFTSYRFEKAEGELVTMLELHGASSFIPGRGSEGSSRRRTISRLQCGLSAGRVVCSAPTQVFSESCLEDDCTREGQEPKL
jgi:hypothetical protein